MRLLWIRNITFVLILTGLLAGCSFQLNPYSLDTTIIDLPHEPLALQDIYFEPRLNRVVVPEAEAGTLALFDPVNPQEFIRIPDLTQAGPVGPISAVVARNNIYVLDQSGKRVLIVNPNAREVIGEFAVQDTPDDIVFIATTNELWITEKNAKQIEIFQLVDGNPPTAERTNAITFLSGPEGLIIDRKNPVAYANEPDSGTTAVINILTKSVPEKWGNGCSQAGGMALDYQRGYLIVACREGKMVIMDARNKGAQLTSVNYGGDLKTVAYNPNKGHIYLPSGATGILGIFSIEPGPLPTQTPSSKMTPTPLPYAPTATPVPSNAIHLIRRGTADTNVGANCVTFDILDQIWVCDPQRGGLFLILDEFPANLPDTQATGPTY